jgi:hypothetical protein
MGECASCSTALHSIIETFRGTGHLNRRCQGASPSSANSLIFSRHKISAIFRKQCKMLLLVKTIKNEMFDVEADTTETVSLGASGCCEQSAQVGKSKCWGESGERLAPGTLRTPSLSTD